MEKVRFDLQLFAEEAPAQAQPEVLKDAAPAEAAKPTEQEKAPTEESPKGE